MKMRILILILIALTSSIISCKKQDKNASGLNDPSKKTTRSKAIETEKENVDHYIRKANRNKPTRNIGVEKMEKNLIAMKQAKNEQNIDLADYLMGDFLDAWNPIGKSKGDLEKALGKPDRIEPSSSSYLLDSGYGGWEWKFVFEGEKIIHFERLGLN